MIGTYFLDNEKSSWHPHGSFDFIHNVSNSARTGVKIGHRFVEGGCIFHSHGFVEFQPPTQLTLPP